MWRKQDEGKPSSASSGSVISPAPEQPRSLGLPPVEPGAVAGNLTKSITIKGDITGREDLFVDGEVQGSIRLGDGAVTVGPNGRVTAEIEAREIHVRGKVLGTLRGRERVQIGRTGEVSGDVVTRLISIEEGAVLRGKVDVGAAQETRPARGSTPAGSAEAPRPVPLRAKNSQP